MGATYIKDTNSIKVNGDGLYEIEFPALIAYAAKDKTFLLIGDKHNAASIMQTAIAKETITALKQQGFAHLCMEIPNQLQGDINRYNKGKMSHSQLEKKYKTFGTPWLSNDENKAYNKRLVAMFKEAKEVGISIHFMDTREPVPIKKQNPRLATMSDNIMLMHPEAVGPLVERLEEKEPGISSTLNNFAQTAFSQRFDRDKTIAQQMKKMAKTGKVAMIFGVNHFNRANDINEHLGKDRSTVIAMQESWQQTEPLTEGLDADLPDFVFYTKFPSSKGTITAAAKLEPDDTAQRSEICKIAVNAVRGTNILLGCALEDKQFEDYAENSMLPKNQSSNKTR